MVQPRSQGSLQGENPGNEVGYGLEEIMNETAILLVLIGNPFRYEPLCYAKSDY